MKRLVLISVALLVVRCQGGLVNPPEQPLPPTSPVILRVLPGQTWIDVVVKDASINEVKFEFEKFNGQGWEAVGELPGQPGTGNVFHFEIGGLEPDTTYSIRVRAVDGLGVGSPWAEAQETTQGSSG